MNWLPIVASELRVAARRRRTYYFRSLGAAVAIFICFGMLLAGFGGLLSSSSAGRGLFLTLSALGYGYVLLQGALCTADCLSREKREGTIGLLFLTDLKGFDVVTGKIMAQPWNALYILLATFPVPSFAFVLGGITWWDFVRIALALPNVLFFSAAVGMLASALSYHERTAINGAVGSALLLGGAIPSLGYLWMTYHSSTTISPCFLVLSPAGAFMSVIFPGLVAAPDLVYGFSFLITHALGWAFFLLAGGIIPRVWQQRNEAVDSPNRFSRGLAKQGRTKKPSRALTRASHDPWQEVNPVFRLGLLLERRNPQLRRALLVLSVFWIVGMLVYPTGWREPGFFLSFALFLHYMVRFSLAIQACRAFGEERRSGMMELLLTTPLGEDEILRGRLIALKRQFVMPILLVLGLDALLMVTGLPGQPSGTWQVLLVSFLAGVVLLLADLYALAWVGLWFGLKYNSASRAIRQTLFAVLLVPWFLWLASLAFIGLLTGGQFGPELFVLGLIWAFLLFGMNNVGMVGWATNRLRDDFRPAATDTFIGSPFKR